VRASRHCPPGWLGWRGVCHTRLVRQSTNSGDGIDDTQRTENTQNAAERVSCERRWRGITGGRTDAGHAPTMQLVLADIGGGWSISAINQHVDGTPLYAAFSINVLLPERIAFLLKRVPGPLLMTPYGPRSAVTAATSSGSVRRTAHSRRHVKPWIRRTALETNSPHWDHPINESCDLVIAYSRASSSTSTAIGWLVGWFVGLLVV